MTYLNSVGSFVDLDNGMVYPANEDNTPDLDCGVEFDNLSSEWLETVTDDELQLIIDYIVFNN